MAPVKPRTLAPIKQRTMARINLSKDFALDLSDDDGDDQSVASFDDDVTPMDVDFMDAPAHDENEIVFANADELRNPEGLDETFFDDDIDDADLQGYEDYGQAESFDGLQGYDDYMGGNDANADFVPYRDEDDVAPPAAKRTRTLKASARPSQPAHFHQTTNAAERSAKRATIDGSRSYDIDDTAGVAYSAPSRVPGTFGRRNREKGSTLPAYHKKVSHELDSDDELMIAMRDCGYSDKQVSDRLVREGRVRYDPKSISTRVQRIKLVQAERADFELENGMKEWTIEDDMVLYRAFDLAGIEIAYEIERLRAWRFKKTSEWMRRINKTSVFSGKACQARYSALQDGTAVIPTAVDDDPEQRRIDMEKFRQEREDAREKAREEKEAKDAEARRIKEEAQLRNARNAREVAKNILAKKAAANQRAAHRATQKSLSEQRAEDNLRRKTQAAADKEAKAKASEQERKFREEFALRHFKHVTEDTPDPRRVLDAKDLRKLCRLRRLNDHTPRLVGEASKQVLLQRLQDADEALQSKELTAMCKARGIPPASKKVVMKYQLALCAARSCDSFVQDDGEADGGDETEAGVEDRD